MKKSTHKTQDISRKEAIKKIGNYSKYVSLTTLELI